MKTQVKGITLIALVVTIIVLLILAAVAMNLSIGENGIFKKATDSKVRTEKASIIEEIQMEIMDEQISNEGKVYEDELISLLESYGSLSDEENILDKTLTTNDGNHDIKVSEIYNGELNCKKVASAEEAYFGYYADLNGDGRITIEDDGLIYADLAIGRTGKWNGDDYKYDAVTEGLSEYVIKPENNMDPLKTGKGIIQLAKKNEKDRFFVMALEDVNPGTKYCWYSAASGKLDKIVESKENDFGKGKENTAYVMEKWNKGTEEGGWGAHNANETYEDLWGIIKPKIEKGWFLPSKSEWYAFINMMDEDFEMHKPLDLKDVGLLGQYWSSSQWDDVTAYKYAVSLGGMIGGFLNRSQSYVRLSTTF